MSLKSSRKRSRSEENEVDAASSEAKIPQLDVSSSSFDPKLVTEAYQKYQAVHLKNVSPTNKTVFGWKNIGNLFESLSREDQESWCLETAGSKEKHTPPQDFLQPKLLPCVVAYCSFLVQKDPGAYSTLVDNLLPVQAIEGTTWHYEPCIWIFFGRNPKISNAKDLQGRPEHTDSVSHDGTWHYQLSGRKIWTIRPTVDLLEKMRQEQRNGSNTTCSPGWVESTTIQVDCQQGDILIINTRLWFHQTVIPPQDQPSVSYARDFWVAKPSTNYASSSAEKMTNVDGMYATNQIEPGTIIFTEKDMPDGELHRSKTNPNCEVVELEDGTNAVVSCRLIQSGEFFCVAESSDDEEEEDVESVEFESEDED
jgi:hypothetical protein